MKSQRGSILVYLIAAAAVLATLGGIYYAIDSRGYARGKLEIQSEWTAANAAAQAEADAQRLERTRLAAEQSAKLATAQGRARDADTRWRAARTEAAREAVPLVVADCTGPTGSLPAAAPGGGGLRMATSLRFTSDFVRRYDSAWTNSAGEPVFGDPDRPLEAPGSASTVTADDLLTVHGENASRCSANSRQMNALINLLEKLRAYGNRAIQ